MLTIDVDGLPLTVKGSIVKIGEIRDEYWLEKGLFGHPKEIISSIKRNRAKLDIFTFTQKLPDTLPLYEYYSEWTNIAALEITTFEHWWTKQINDKTRNMVRKAQKKGVEVRLAAFDDALIEGITGIYNETPIRQGRPFLHYGKDIGSVKNENETFLDRSDFIGAYYGAELIGFVKLVRTGDAAGLMQIVSKIKDRDKAPTNALLAKSVEVCAERDIKFLTYAKFTYGKKGVDPIAQFKLHNGFRKIDLPKYYVPLSVKGKIGLVLRLHHDFVDLVPGDLMSYVQKRRADWYERKVKEDGQKRKVS